MQMAPVKPNLATKILNHHPTMILMLIARHLYNICVTKAICTYILLLFPLPLVVIRSLTLSLFFNYIIQTNTSHSVGEYTLQIHTVFILPNLEILYIRSHYANETCKPAAKIRQPFA